MTHDEIMDLVNRSLFAEIGYTDEDIIIYCMLRRNYYVTCSKGFAEEIW